MNEIIKIVDHKGQRIVDARELHKFLGSKRDFSNWINDRIKKYEFNKNVDYISFNKIVERATGGAIRKEYGLTTDVAKEVSMVENNDKGRQARRYFIEMEKIVLNKAISLPSKKELAQMVIEQENKIEALSEDNQLKEYKITNQNLQLRQAAPKVEYHDEVLGSKDAHHITIIAKTFNMSAMALNKILHEEKVQFRTEHRKHFNSKTQKWSESFSWVPYRKYQDEGYCKIATRKIKLKNGEIKVGKELLWFEKGQKFIYEMLKKRDMINIEQELNFQ